MTYYLKELSNGEANKIAIPNGQTTLGRGPFLRCSDKKVSRNHAELELTNDNTLFITPLHVNPSFYYEKGVKDSRTALEKDKRHKLNSGDWISLLPDSLHYEIVLETKRISAKDKSVDSNTEVPQKSASNTTPSVSDAGITTLSKQTQNGASPMEEHKPSAAACENESCHKDMNVTKAVLSQRKRTLPDWLVQLANGSDTGEASENPVVKRKTPSTKTSTSSTTNRKTNKKVSKRVSISDDEDDVDVKPSTPCHHQAKVSAKPKFHISDNSENDEDDAAQVEPKASKQQAKASTEQYVAGGKKRKPCEFGKKCYRKNTVHFAECSHPGDSDYMSETEDAPESDKDDDRPECEYGTDCYRKNPQHRKEYKHTTRPKRKAAKEAQRKAKMRDDDNGEDSFESSFIDDDDSHDDSNYSPDDEDIKTLKKEANEFVRNKKLYQST